MTVYVDAVRIPAEVPNGDRVVRGTWSQLVADTSAELMDVATRIGLRPEWIQHPGGWGALRRDRTETPPGDRGRCGRVVAAADGSVAQRRTAADGGVDAGDPAVNGVHLVRSRDAPGAVSAAGAGERQAFGGGSLPLRTAAPFREGQPS